MNGVVATMVIVAMSALILFALRDSDMEQCMVKYSQETCYHMLAR